MLGGDGAGVFAVQKEGAGFIAEGWGGQGMTWKGQGLHGVWDRWGVLFL